MLSGSSGFRPNREYEALSRRAKRHVKWRSGVRNKAMRKFWKRTRRAAKAMLRHHHH